MSKLNSKRQEELFKLVYENTKAISRKLISSKLNVSTRTVLSEIKELNYILGKYDCRIITIRGEGYKLKISSNIRKNYLYNSIMEDNNEFFMPVNSEERSKYIIIQLLGTNGYITIQQLSERLFISKQTISNDLKKTRNILENYNLKLQTKASYGMNIVGKEINKRRCFSKCLPFRENNENLYEIGTIEKKFFKNVNLQLIYDIVNIHVKRYSGETLDTINKIIAIHIAISITRIRSNQQLSFDIPEYIDENREEVKFTNNLIKEIEENIEIKFSKQEIYNILIYVMCCTIHKDNTTYSMEYNPDKIVERMLREILNIYNYDFTNDIRLKQDLKVHIISLIKRIKYNIWINNPMTKQIKKQYSIYFEMAISALKIAFEKDIQIIDEGEIGFIALHLAAADVINKGVNDLSRIVIVCGSGVGSGKLIEAIIKRNFIDIIEVEKVMSYLEYDSKENLDCDFVLSTVPIKEKNVPIAKIGIMPRKEEIQNIVKKMKLSKRKENNNLHNILKNELFYKVENLKTKNEIIEFLSQELLKKGYVNHEFKNSIYEREKISSTYMDFNIAMPHPISNKALKSGIAVAICKNGIKWDGNIVKIVLLINVIEDDYDKLNSIYNKLVDIFDDYTLIEKLIETNTFSEFLEIMINI